MRQQRKPKPVEPLDAHKRQPIDSGEYMCTCGWVPSWSGPSLDDQIASHHAKVSEGRGNSVKSTLRDAHHRFVNSRAARTIGWVAGIISGLFFVWIFGYAAGVNSG